MKYSTNNFIDALLKTILVGAIFHLTLLTIYVVQHGQWEMLNAFHIQDLDRYFPQLGKGPVMFALSYLVMTIVFVYFLLKNKKKS
jgi:hypothetical protein